MHLVEFTVEIPVLKLTRFLSFADKIICKLSGKSASIPLLR